MQRQWVSTRRTPPNAHQPAATLHEVEFRPGNHWVIVNVEDDFRPCERKRQSDCSHEPEAALPPLPLSQPSEQRAERKQREVLRRIENRRRTPTLCGRKPRRYNPSVSWKHRRLRQPRDQSQSKNRREHPRKR